MLALEPEPAAVEPEDLVDGVAEEEAPVPDRIRASSTGISSPLRHARLCMDRLGPGSIPGPIASVMPAYRPEPARASGLRAFPRRPASPSNAGRPADPFGSAGLRWVLRGKATLGCSVTGRGPGPPCRTGSGRGGASSSAAERRVRLVTLPSLSTRIMVRKLRYCVVGQLRIEVFLWAVGRARTVGFTRLALVGDHQGVTSGASTAWVSPHRRRVLVVFAPHLWLADLLLRARERV